MHGSCEWYIISWFGYEINDSSALKPPLSYKLKLTEFDETLSKSRVSCADFGTEFGFWSFSMV